MSTRPNHPPTLPELANHDAARTRPSGTGERVETVAPAVPIGRLNERDPADIPARRA